MPSVRRRTVLRAALIGSMSASAAGCAGLNRALGLGDFVRIAVSWSATELAAFQRVLGPGITWTFPGFDRLVSTVDMRIRSTPFQG